MKVKYLIFVALVLSMISLVNAGNIAGTRICYQESANQSTSCGGLSTGNYSTFGDYAGLNGNGFYSIDGDYSTYTQVENVIGDSILYINYSKPFNSINASWYVKYSHAPTMDDYYVSFRVNDSCFANNNINLRVNKIYDFLATYHSNLTLLQCYNSTAWINISQINDQGYYFYFMEESINWTLSDLFENSQTFNNDSYEVSNENFSINLTIDSNVFTLSNATFTYNNTIYNTTILTYGNNKIITSNITLPLVPSSGTNLTFYWTMGLTNSSGTYYFNSSFNNQTVNKGIPLVLSSSCLAGLSPAFNFTSYWEQNLSNVNMSVNYYITYGLSGNPNSYSINGTLTNINSLLVCLNNSQSYYDIGYGELQYSVDGAVNRRYYIFSNTRATNQTISVPLYALDSSISTSFLFTAQTTTLSPYKGYYIGLLRWYPSINSYNLVEMAKTDDKGQSVLHIKTEDVDYRIGLYQSNGVLVKLLNPIRFICQTNPCTYAVSIDPNPLDLTSYTNIQSSLTFNPTTKIFTFTWNDPSQTSQTMNLSVFRGDELVCNSYASGYTGLITCDVSAYSGVLIAEVYRTASPSKMFRQLYAEIKQTFIDAGGGDLALFIGAILVMLFALIGSFSPVMVVILGIIALLPMYLLGGITTAILMAIGVLGGVILHFLKRTNG